MKIQYLAVIFVIIMLPISLVFSEYIGAQVNTLKLQINYDTKLDNATYDAIKAFQLNTVNSSTSDLVNSKIRDIEAGANSFFISLGTAFNMVGYNSDALKEYVPALVYTMYDGFYIYSPFENTLDEETKSKIENGSTYTGADGEKITGLKPYIFYSCRYVKEQIDVVITYSLDNYITIQGKDKNGNPINDAGYLLSDVSYNSNEATYRGVKISKEETLSEFIGNKEYKYIKINGVKYYFDNDNNQWFTLMNGKKIAGQGNFNAEYNDMGYRYYQEAADFKKRLENYGITNLTPMDAQGVEDIKDEDGKVIYSFTDGASEKIFDFNDIEEPYSNFNEHRLAVIRYVIESNLTVALANYNNYGAQTFDFSMPKLAEEDWDRILNNVSLISFLQGLSIGGKIYNGYSVINNNKNEEVVTEDSIYITTKNNSGDNYFHRITEKDLAQNNINLSNYTGVFNIDFERKSMTDTNGNTTYYYPRRQLGCYSCVVAQTNTADISNIYEYLDDYPALAKVYYTALGRERYSTYKVFRYAEEHINMFR